MSMESLSKRIKTTEDLRNIVSTMKSLSSVSILQYEQAQKSLIEYTHTIRNAFHALIKTNAVFIPTHEKTSATPKTIAIVIGSDNGLVGRFNKEIMQTAALSLKEKGISPKDAVFITVGKRVAALAEQQQYDLFAKYAVSNSIKAINSIASTVIVRMEEAMEKTKATRVLLFYHKRLPNQPTEIEQITLLPFALQQYKNLKNEPWPTNNVPLITLKPQVLVSKLIQEYLMIVLSGAITMSLVAEHHARMINMQNAEKNIDESLEQMNLEFQQKRQEAITEELIDVVSGSEALQVKKRS